MIKKKILLTIIIGIFLITLINAAEFNNIDLIKDKNYISELRTTDTLIVDGHLTKQYIANEKRLIITGERKWWDILQIWTEDSLLDISLESDYEVAVISKSDALIAWFNLSDFIGDNIVDNVRFYDVNDNYKELNKGHKFKYQNESNDWTEFDLLEELPNKNIKIGLFTDIEFGDRIEWIIEKDGFEVLEWALVIGTNAGFVTVAPSVDPDDSTAITVDGYAVAFKDTSPATATKITEIGWWAETGGSAANFEVGLYSHNVGDDEPEERLFVDTINAKGTSTGWKTVTVDWEINPDTIYWIGMQLDDTASFVSFVLSDSGGRFDRKGAGETELTNPWGTTDTEFSRLGAIYAVWEAAGEIIAPNTTINTPTNTTFTTNSILFNVTATDDTAMDTCLYSLNGGTNNFTMTNITSEYTDTNSSMAQGPHTANFYCNDSLNNLNDSESVIFFIDSINPSVTSLTESPTDSPVFTPSQTYEFNATVTDTNLESIILEFDGVNYTASNVTTDVYNVTFVALSVGTYNYRWYANDTLGNVNSSEIGSYEITKADPSSNMVISGTTPIEYGITSDFSESETNTGDGGCSYSLDLPNIIYGVGTTEFNYSTTGCTNYTSGSVTKDLVVNKNSSYVIDITKTSPIEYPAVTDFAGIDCPSELSCSLNISNQIYSAGAISSNYSTPGNANYTAKSTIDTITINQNSSTTLGLTASTPIEYPTVTDFTGSSCPSQLSCSLNISNIVYGAGTISANYSTSGNANYSATSSVFTVTINKNSSLVLGISGTTPITYSTSTDVSGSSCPSQLSCSLDKSNKVYEAGIETFNYSTAGNTNYTTDSVTKSITINQATGSIFAYVNNLRANYAADNDTATGKENIWLNASLETGVGNIALYLNNTLINNGTSPISNLSNLFLGSYYVNATYYGTTNYTSDSERWFINISQSESLEAQNFNFLTSFTSTIIKLLVGFIALALLAFSFMGIFIYSKNDFSDIKGEDFIKYAVSLLIILVLFIALINYIVSEVL